MSLRLRCAKNRSSALVAENNEIADLLLCCSHTVVNGIMSHHAVSQLITEPTVGMVVFFVLHTPPLYCKTGVYSGIVILCEAVLACTHNLCFRGGSNVYPQSMF